MTTNSHDAPLGGTDPHVLLGRIIDAATDLAHLATRKEVRDAHGNFLGISAPSETRDIPVGFIELLQELVELRPNTPIRIAPTAQNVLIELMREKLGPIKPIDPSRYEEKALYAVPESVAQPHGPVGERFMRHHYGASGYVAVDKESLTTADDRRAQQVAYPGIDKRKVRGETPRVDELINERLGRMVALDPAYHYVQQIIDFARQLERELAEAKRQILMDTECIERIRNAAYEVEKNLDRANTRLENNFAFNTDGERIACKSGEIPDGIECRDATIAGQDKIIEELRAKPSDAKTVVAGLAQVSEMAHKENAALRRRLDEALDVIERHEAEKKANVLAEREACARVCDSRSDEHWKSYKTIGPFRGDSRAETWGDEAEECAKAIRARTGGKP